MAALAVSVGDLASCVGISYLFLIFVIPAKAEEAIEAVEAAGAEVVPLPPYSPDLTPIEEMVSKVKGAMKSATARTTNAVYWAFASALDQVTLNDITGWFQSRAAYAMRL